MDPVKDTTRDSINAAIESLESKDPTDPPAAEPKTPPAGDPPAADPSEAPVGDPPAADPANVGQKPAPAAASGTPSTVPAVVAVKPPQSWKPEMRERWNTLPPEVQQEVLRREREISTGLQSAAEARRFHEEFNKVSAPYQQYLAAHTNGNPMEAFGNYLRTATLLRTGSPQEKAAAVASAIREYAIDVAILDSALASQMRGQPAPQRQQQQPAQFRDPRVDEMLQERQREEQERLTAELTTFSADPKNEFYNDVRQDMADLLEFNASRGKKMTLQEAYNQTIKLNDSVQATLAARTAKNQQLAGARRVQQARAAGTPAAGRAAPAAGAPAKRGDSIRDDISAAIDSLQPE